MHTSVLYDEVLSYLAPQAGEKYIDGTLGFGGHSEGILNASQPDGRLMAFDRDQDAIALAKERLGQNAKRTVFIHDSFAQMATHANQQKFLNVDGIVLDLGLSSMQLDSRTRGFSFRYEAPLDMRFDQTAGWTAADYINNYSEAELADVFWRYGEERRSRKIARLVIENRPITTTTQLATLIKENSSRRGRTHPATQVFQALRILVNDELGALETGLPAAIKLLKTGGRIAVISFHSLEDRYVKTLFRELSKDCICPPEQPMCICEHQPTLKLAKRKAIKPSNEEILNNSRSRSARLRIAEKL